MPGPCLVGNCTELKKKGIKTQQRKGWGGKDKQAAQSIVCPGQFQMQISDHCTIFLCELGFLPQRQQKQLPTCDKRQGFSGAAKALHVDPACEQKNSLVMKEALSVTWKDKRRPLWEVTQPSEQCEVIFAVPLYEERYSFLSAEPMSFFLTKQIDAIQVKSCPPLAEEKEENAEGSEVNVAVTQLCFLRQNWHPWMFKVPPKEPCQPARGPLAANIWKQSLALYRCSLSHRACVTHKAGSTPTGLPHHSANCITTVSEMHEPGENEHSERITPES